MANATFRHTLTSTNAVLNHIQEENNRSLAELRKEIQQNTVNINRLLQTTPVSSLRNNRFVTSRKRRRLLPQEDALPKQTPLKAVGTREIDSDADVIVPIAATVESKLWLYLSGFAPQATVAEIERYVQKCLNTNGTVVVAKLVPKNINLDELSFVSFKVGVDLELRESALNSSSWHKGIVFREFDFQHTRKRPSRSPFRPSPVV